MRGEPPAPASSARGSSTRAGDAGQASEVDLLFSTSSVAKEDAHLAARSERHVGIDALARSVCKAHFAGQGVEAVRPIRDEIRQRVLQLLDTLTPSA